MKGQLNGRDVLTAKRDKPSLLGWRSLQAAAFCQNLDTTMWAAENGQYCDKRREADSAARRDFTPFAMLTMYAPALY